MLLLFRPRMDFTFAVRYLKPSNGDRQFGQTIETSQVSMDRPRLSSQLSMAETMQVLSQGWTRADSYLQAVAHEGGSHLAPRHHQDTTNASDGGKLWSTQSEITKSRSPK